MDSNDLEILPEKWKWKATENLVREEEDIRRGPFGSAIKKAFFVPSGYKVYQQKNVIYNDFALGDYYIDEKRFRELRRFEIRSGDILITCSGTIGGIAQVPDGIVPGVMNQALLKVTLDSHIINPRYFIHLFKSKLKDILRHSTRGSAMQNLTSVLSIKKMLWPVPPLDDQDLLLSRIEETHKRIDTAKQELSRIPALTRRLRMTILSKAFRGELFAGNQQDESASVHFSRIEGYTSKGKCELDATNDTLLWNISSVYPYNIPENWFWIQLRDISIESGCGATPLRTKKQNFPSDGIPLIKVQNIVENGRVALFAEQLRIANAIHNGVQKRSRVQPDDILVNIVGPPLGKIGLVGSEISEANINQAIVFFRMHKEIVPEYVWYALQSPIINAALRSMGKGVRQENIRRSDVGKILIPLAPHFEQIRIVKRIKELLPLIEKSIRESSTCEHQLNQLEQSILTKAFQGEL